MSTRAALELRLCVRFQAILTVLGCLETCYLILLAES